MLLKMDFWTNMPWEVNYDRSSVGECGKRPQGEAGECVAEKMAEKSSFIL